MSDFIDNTYERVEKLINYKRLNISSFEDKIKVSNNSIGTAIRRKASFKSNVLNKILNSFPDINPTWILTGKGNMLLYKEGNDLLEEPNSIYNTTDLTAEVKINLLDLLSNDTEVGGVLEEKIQNILKK